jgi:hypothetical protein
MTDTCDGRPTRSASCDDGCAKVARGIARWLCLGATPAFAIMALMTSMLGGGPMDTLGSAGHGSQLTGMVPMYVLMSAFHLAPWLTLISRRRSGAYQKLSIRAAPTGRGSFCGPFSPVKG